MRIKYLISLSFLVHYSMAMQIEMLEMRLPGLVDESAILISDPDLEDNARLEELVLGQLAQASKNYADFKRKFNDEKAKLSTDVQEAFLELEQQEIGKRKELEKVFYIDNYRISPIVCTTWNNGVRERLIEKGYLPRHIGELVHMKEYNKKKGPVIHPAFKEFLERNPEQKQNIATALKEELMFAGHYRNYERTKQLCCDRIINDVCSCGTNVCTCAACWWLSYKTVQTCLVTTFQSPWLQCAIVMVQEQHA